MSAAPKIFIGTATANGVMVSDYVHALVRMVAHLTRAGVTSTFGAVDGPDLFVQRDILARDFLASDCTHLLMIGSHVSFPPDLALRLLAAGKPLVGAVHPRRALDLERLRQLTAERDFDAALALSFDWGVRLLGTTVTVRKGLCRVAGLASAFLLLERDCLSRMVAQGVAPPYQAYHADLALHAFFRDLPGEALRIEREEVIGRRWQAAGGDIWAYVASEVRAVSELRFGLPFHDYLGALRGLKERPGMESASKD